MAVHDEGFERTIGLRSAIAINMTQMCGIGPFVTIPLMIAAFGGPQAIFGWIVGALLALADGLVWAELGGALPGAGGTYVYLREAFQHRTGRLLPFLFVWTAMFTIPLIMSTGVIGLIQYLGYLIPDMSWVEIHGLSLIVVAIVLFSLYRRVAAVGAITTVLWIVVLLSTAIVIVASLTHFHSDLAFDFTPGAFSSGGAFWAGLGGGLLIGIYDYLGYNTTAYLGAEVKDPGRVLPRSIVISVLGIMVIYLLMNIGVLGVVPWQEASKSDSVASLVLERTWGKTAADITTVLILVTAFGSVFAGLLGGSRVPYNAAKDGVFFKPFGRLHPRHRFPHVALLAMGLVTAVGHVLHAHDGDLGAAGGVRDHPGDRAGGRPDGAAPRAAGPRAAVQDVAVSPAEPDRAGGLGLHLHLRGPHPDHLLDRRDRRRRARLPRLGASRGGVAVRPGATGERVRLVRGLLCRCRHPQ